MNRASSYFISPCSSAAILTFAVLVHVGTLSFSQGLHNASNLYISGAAIYVDGEVTNEGRLENDGVVALTGDWRCVGKYSGNGTIEVYGNGPQKFAHDNQTVEKLVINGWGTKYIKGKIRIGGELHLQTGVVEVSAQDVLKLKDKAVAVGGSADTYVDGALTVEGTGYKFFPIGKNGNYAPIELLDVQGTSAEYSIEVFENAPVVSVGEVIVRNSLYWYRKDIAGSFGGSAVALEYDPDYFEDIAQITLLAGTTWEEPFITIDELEHSAETDKISTRTSIAQPIIMLGEISQRWTEADFYLSTALSPHATQTINHSIKVFGQRLVPDNFRFQVFNRWGQLVFESLSLKEMTDNGWDGRTLSGMTIGGTYPYRLNGFDKTGKKFEKTGVITIVH